MSVEIKMEVVVVVGKEVKAAFLLFLFALKKTLKEEGLVKKKPKKEVCL
jgi:hypothetical protein